MPVITVNISRGISVEIFFKLCSLAPLTMICVSSSPKSSLSFRESLLMTFLLETGFLGMEKGFNIKFI